jgi:hypothetical protein
MPRTVRLSLLAALSAFVLAATGGTAGGSEPRPGPRPGRRSNAGRPARRRRGTPAAGQPQHEARQQAQAHRRLRGHRRCRRLRQVRVPEQVLARRVSNGGGTGTGVEVVDISNPKKPKNIAFIPAHENSYVGEGVHVVRADTPSFKGDILIHNNETATLRPSRPRVPRSGTFRIRGTRSRCRSTSATRIPRCRGRPITRRTALTCSSSVMCCRAARTGSSRRCKTTRIWRTSTSSTCRIRALRSSCRSGDSRTGPAQGSYANGDTVFHHDMQHKRIRGHDFLLASYWDAGHVLLNIDNPANPVVVGDSDFRLPDPLMPAFVFPEGSATSRIVIADGERVQAPGRFQDGVGCRREPGVSRAVR